MDCRRTFFPGPHKPPHSRKGASNPNYGGNAIRKVWAERTEEERQAIARKIGDSLRGRSFPGRSEACASRATLISKEVRVARAKAGQAGFRRDAALVSAAMRKAAATRRRRALGPDFLRSFFAEIRKRGGGWVGRILDPAAD